MGVSSGILLKTAKAKLFNIKSDEKVATRLVLDSGSQRSYIEDNVWKLLKLKTIRTEQVNDSQMQVLYVGELKIKHCHQNKFVFIEVYVYQLFARLLKYRIYLLVKKIMNIYRSYN